MEPAYYDHPLRFYSPVTQQLYMPSQPWAVDFMKGQDIIATQSFVSREGARLAATEWVQDHGSKCRAVVRRRRDNKIMETVGKEIA